MSNFVFKLPDIGEGVVEGEVVQWHVSVGDSVSEDDPIVDVMTDKATVTIPSPTSGVIASLSGGVGDMIAVGTTLLEISTGEVMGSEGGMAVGGDEGADTDPEPAPAPAPTPKAPSQSSTGRVLASPAVRKRARENLSLIHI